MNRRNFAEKISRIANCDCGLGLTAQKRQKAVILQNSRKFSPAKVFTRLYGKLWDVYSTCVT